MCIRDSSCTSHLTDIGGLGTGADGTDVHMEGIYIPMLKLADKGVMNETLLAMIRQNTRQPIESEGDVFSLAACNDIGCKRLIEMMEELLTRQRIFYTRLTLSDDLDAIKMKESILSQAKQLGFPQDVNLDHVFSNMVSMIDNMKKSLSES